MTNAPTRRPGLGTLALLVALGASLGAAARLEFRADEGTARVADNHDHDHEHEGTTGQVGTTETSASSTPKVLFEVENLNCPILGREADPTATVVVEGLSMAICCPPCEKKIRADPAAAVKKLLDDPEGGEGLRAFLAKNPQLAKRLGVGDRPTSSTDVRGNGSAPPAPAPGAPVVLQNPRCPVMGDPIEEGEVVVWRGIGVRICCPSCRETFLQYPPYYLAKIAREQGITVPKPLPEKTR